MIFIEDTKGIKGLIHYAPYGAILPDTSSQIICKAIPGSPELLTELMPLLPQAGLNWVPVPYSGTDPEIFVTKGDGSLLPAWEFLQAKPTKNNGGCSTYWDGAQAEISFGAGDSCHQRIVMAVRGGLSSILSAAQQVDPTATLCPMDVVELPEATLANATDEHILLGCAPSVNPYGIDPLFIPEPRKHSLRYSGAHLHFSCNQAPPEWFPFGTAVMMDKVAGIMLTALGRDYEDPRRRLAYGRPGEHRVPSQSKDGYRLEYRTPGSFLLRAPQLFIFAMDIARLAFKLGHLWDGRDFPLPDAHEIIMACDADSAVKYMKKHRSFFDAMAARLQPNHSKAAMALLVKGAKASGLGQAPLSQAWRFKEDLDISTFDIRHILA